MKAVAADSELGMNPQGQENPSLLLLSSCSIKFEGQINETHVRVCTHRTEVCVLYDVLGHSMVGGRQRHDEQQGVSGLLTDRTLPETEISNFYSQRMLSAY